MKRILLFFLIIQALPAQSQNDTLNIDEFDYFELACLQYHTGFQNRTKYWVVVEAINKQNLQSNEVCVNMKDLRFFVLKTLKWSVYDSNVISSVDSVIFQNKKRQFLYDPSDKLNKFPNLELYTMEDLLKAEELLNLDSIKLSARSNREKWINTYSDKEMCIISHLLYNEKFYTYEYSCSGSLLWEANQGKMKENIPAWRVQRLQKTIHNNSQKANASDSVNLKRNASNKR